MPTMENSSQGQPKTENLVTDIPAPPADVPPAEINEIENQAEEGELDIHEAIIKSYELGVDRGKAQVKTEVKETVNSIPTEENGKKDCWWCGGEDSNCFWH
jgi:hypothetical protein